MQLTDTDSAKALMGDQLRAARRERTRFTEYQLSKLRDTFRHTQHPKWDQVLEVASEVQLPESVVKSWFKNQLTKRKKQQQASEQQPVTPEGSPHQDNNGGQVPSAATLHPQLPSSRRVHPGPKKSPQSAKSAAPGPSVPPACLPVEELEVSLTELLSYSIEELATLYRVSAWTSISGNLHSKTRPAHVLGWTASCPSPELAALSSHIYHLPFPKRST